MALVARRYRLFGEEKRSQAQFANFDRWLWNSASVGRVFPAICELSKAGKQLPCSWEATKTTWRALAKVVPLLFKIILRKSRAHATCLINHLVRCPMLSTYLFYKTKACFRVHRLRSQNNLKNDEKKHSNSYVHRPSFHYILLFSSIWFKARPKPQNSSSRPDKKTYISRQLFLGRQQTVLLSWCQHSTKRWNIVWAYQELSEFNL